MAGLRVLIHALVFLILAQGLALLADRNGSPGLVAIEHFIHWGSYVPFAIAASSALNKHKPMVLALLAGTVLLGAPGSLQALSEQLAPIGAGIIAGTLANSFITNERRTTNDDEPEQPKPGA